MTPLCKLAEKYGTDKGHPHQYTPVYFEELASHALAVSNVLEIGICTTRNIKNGRTGASLYMWREFFPNAMINGVDIDPASMVTDARIRSFLGNSTNKDAMAAIMRSVGTPQVIVDDGSHDPADQIKTARILLPYLPKGGWYFIEDVYVDPLDIIAGVGTGDDLGGALSYNIYEGGKPLPEGYGRRSFGGPPAGEILITIRR